MWPWEHVGNSAADGILDDETYDWIPVVRALADGRGAPIVVTEAQIMEGERTRPIDHRDQRVAHGNRGPGRAAGSARRHRIQ
jgi:hypothetical protein